jgi:hypothetical protein
VLTGEAAERRAQTEPARTAREFKRRLGDPVPLLLGGTPYDAEALYAQMLRSVVAQVTQQRGEGPRVVVITHPASYGPYKLDLLQQAVRQAGIGDAVLLSEPVAAATTMPIKSEPRPARSCRLRLRRRTSMRLYSQDQRGLPAPRVAGARAAWRNRLTKAVLALSTRKRAGRFRH